MDQATLNEILSFLKAEYEVTQTLPASGQRRAYLATRSGGGGKELVLKVCPLHPIAVARIKREIKILSELDSEYFPKFYFQFFVTEQMINNFIDNLNPRTQQVRIAELRTMNIHPFLLTVEEFIPHLHWDRCIETFNNEHEVIDLLTHLFKASRLLWDKKIVHRDLKPENILIRESLKPVIIDLGIAKSMSEGATIITNPAFPSPCTPRYAAPEQLMNNKAEVTYKTDQFSIGVLAFFILSKKFPYGNEAEIGIEGMIENFMQDRMDSLREHTNVSDGLVDLINKMLRVRPYQRFRNVDEILDSLEKLKG